MKLLRSPPLGLRILFASSIAKHLLRQSSALAQSSFQRGWEIPREFFRYGGKSSNYVLVGGWATPLKNISQLG